MTHRIVVRVGAMLYKNGSYEGEIKVSYQANLVNIPKRDLFIHVHTKDSKPVLDLDVILEKSGDEASLTVPETKLVGITAKYVEENWSKLLKVLTPRQFYFDNNFWSHEQNRLYISFESGKELRGGFLGEKDRPAIDPKDIGARKKISQRTLVRDFAKRGTTTKRH